MKVLTSISYQSNFVCPIVIDSKELEVINEKQAYNIAYRLFKKLRKRFYPAMIFKGIKTKILENDKT